MKSIYYFDNLSKYEEFTDELDDLYTKATDREQFKQFIFCGDDTLIGDKKGTNPIRYFQSYGDAVSGVNNIVNIFDTINQNMDLKKSNHTKFSQLHLQSSALQFKDYPKLEKWIKEKIFFLYKNKLPHNVDYNLITLSEMIPTLYSTGCELQTHQDGRRYDENDWDFVKFANILIYLNKDYKVENGGLFVIDEKHVIVPDFGNIVILNLEMNGPDPSHCVSRVVGTQDRFAILFQAIYKKRDLSKYL